MTKKEICFILSILGLIAWILPILNYIITISAMVLSICYFKKTKKEKMKTTAKKETESKKLSKKLFRKNKIKNKKTYDKVYIYSFIFAIIGFVFTLTYSIIGIVGYNILPG